MKISCTIFFFILFKLSYYNFYLNISKIRTIFQNCDFYNIYLFLIFNFYGKEKTDSFLS